MEELLKKREDIKKELDELSTKMSILKDQKQEIEAEILPQLKTKDGAKLTMRYEDKTVSIAVRQGFKIIDEKKAINIIPETERENYFKLDKLMFVGAVKEYIKTNNVPEGIESVESEYLNVCPIKKQIKN